MQNLLNSRKQFLASRISGGFPVEQKQEIEKSVENDIQSNDVEQDDEIEKAFSDVLEKGGIGSGRHKDYGSLINNINEEEYKKLINSEYYKKFYKDYTGGSNELSKKKKNDAHRFAIYASYNKFEDDKQIKKSTDDVFEDIMQKGIKGEGKVIGKTETDKDVIDNKQPHKYHDWDHDDHKEAAKIYEKNGNHKMADKHITHASHMIMNDKMLGTDRSRNKIEKSVSNAFEDILEKSGEGSRGGKVIGHTKSGKPIYSTYENLAHEKFTAEDHDDSAKLHRKISEELGWKGGNLKQAKKHEKRRTYLESTNTGKITNNVNKKLSDNDL